MKIIGQTAGGYLVEVSADEIAKAAGYRSDYDADFVTAAGRRSIHDPIRIGTKIDVRAAFDLHSRITHAEEQAKSSAGFLRGLADILENAMPSVVIPPAPVAAASEVASSTPEN